MEAEGRRRSQNVSERGPWFLLIVMILATASCADDVTVSPSDVPDNTLATLALPLDAAESVPAEPPFRRISEAPRIGCAGDLCDSTPEGVYSNLDDARLEMRMELLAGAPLDDGRPSAAVVAQDLAAVRDEARAAVDRGDETMLVSVLLEDPGLAAAELAEIRDGHRDDALTAFVAARRDQLRSSQDAAVAAAREFGAREEGRSWLVNVVDLRVDPARVAELTSLPGFVTMSHDAVATSSTDGWIRQQALGAVATDDQGAFGGRVGPEIRVGVIEVDDDDYPANRLNTGHVGWQDWAGGPSRVIDTDYCRWHGFVRDCSDSASDDDSPADHGTHVASVLMGSIEQAQDSAYTGTDTNAQNMRSGIAREAVLYYYRAGSPDAANVRVAIETAVADGVDVINMSFNYNTLGSCSGTTDVASIRSALNAAENAGVVLVG